MQSDTLHTYSENSDLFIQKYESISSETLLSHVFTYFPPAPARILDIGAGTGRDANWLSRLGYIVTAVEPVAAFRKAAVTLHPTPKITWHDDHLPDLSKLTKRGGTFDLILLSAVWHHLDAIAQDKSLKRFQELLGPNGKIILSIRQGKDILDDRATTHSTLNTTRTAEHLGYSVEARQITQSVQTQNKEAGVVWIWLVLGKYA
ncbi:MAG: class I SAM-dependent methyltransferase [Pseudoruegeria sp.]